MANDGQWLCKCFHAEETKKNIRRTVQFRTLNVETGKIDNAPTCDIQNIFKEAKNEIVFYSRPNKYGAIEVHF